MSIGTSGSLKNTNRKVSGVFGDLFKALGSISTLGTRQYPDGWSASDERAFDGAPVPLYIVYKQSGATTVYNFEDFVGKGGNGSVYRYVAKDGGSASMPESIAVKSKVGGTGAMNVQRTLAGEQCPTMKIHAVLKFTPTTPDNGPNHKKPVSYGLEVSEFIVQNLHDAALISKMRKEFSDPGGVIDVFDQVKDAVECLMRKNPKVFYTDLKMENVMMKDGKVVLVDMESLAQEYTPCITSKYFPNSEKYSDGVMALPGVEVSSAGTWYDTHASKELVMYTLWVFGAELFDADLSDLSQKLLGYWVYHSMENENVVPWYREYKARRLGFLDNLGKFIEKVKQKIDSLGNQDGLKKNYLEAVAKGLRESHAYIKESVERVYRGDNTNLHS